MTRKFFYPILILFFLLPLLAQGAINRLVFITDPQVVPVGELSAVITVQTQDSSGSESKMEETGDLVFVSSSPTGKFLNASGEPVSLVMNRNSANRNFYYRDSSAGSYQLTVTVTGRTGGESWSASQNISIGDGSPVEINGSDTNSGGANNNSSTPSNNSGSNTSSSHNNPVSVSAPASPSTPFQASAGRSRLGAVHSPIFFEAVTSGNLPKSVMYQWSFGDGGSAVGEKVNHVYHFSGEYNVVLNAIGSDGRTAVGRTSVSITEPNIVFGSVSGTQVELINRSSREVNLGGWRISQGNKIFIFPADTIIASGKALAMPTVYLGFIPESRETLSLIYPDLVMVTGSNPSQSSQSSPSLESFNTSLRQLASTLALVAPKNVPTPISSEKAKGDKIESMVSTSTPTTSSIVIIQKSPSLLTKLKQWFTR